VQRFNLAMKQSCATNFNQALGLYCGTVKAGSFSGS
jgi:hypothetical protein